MAVGLCPGQKRLCIVYYTWHYKYSSTIDYTTTTKGKIELELEKKVTGHSPGFSFPFKCPSEHLNERRKSWIICMLILLLLAYVALLTSIGVLQPVLMKKEQMNESL